MFDSCSSLTNITVDALNANFASAAGVLFDKTMDTLILCPGGKTGSYVIPSSVASIGGFAFNGCGSLTSVTVPASVRSLGPRRLYVLHRGIPDQHYGGAPLNPDFASVGRVLFDKNPDAVGLSIQLRRGETMLFPAALPPLMIMLLKTAMAWTA